MLVNTVLSILALLPCVPFTVEGIPPFSAPYKLLLAEPGGVTIIRSGTTVVVFMAVRPLFVLFIPL
jgi:hypothetical protein